MNQRDPMHYKTCGLRINYKSISYYLLHCIETLIINKKHILWLKKKHAYVKDTFGLFFQDIEDCLPRDYITSD